MLKILAEQPILITALLVILALGVLYTWTQGGRSWLLVLGVTLLALVPAAWLVASLVVTDEEEIQLMIERFAATVEANDFGTAYEAIHPDHPEILQRARSELPKYEFSRARVGRYDEIRVLPNTQPAEAIVELIATVTVSVKGSPVQDQKVSRRLLLKLEETPEGWKVTDYAHRNPVGPPDVYSTGGREWDQSPGSPAP